METYDQDFGPGAIWKKGFQDFGSFLVALRLLTHRMVAHRLVPQRVPQQVGRGPGGLPEKTRHVEVLAHPIQARGLEILSL